MFNDGKLKVLYLRRWTARTRNNVDTESGQTKPLSTGPKQLAQDVKTSVTRQRVLNP